MKTKEFIYCITLYCTVRSRPQPLIRDSWFHSFQMSSELKQQVQQLKSKFLKSSSIYADTPSLFFDKKEAGSIDLNIVFDAAVNGLTVLMQYDSRLGTYLSTLLHPSSQQVQRELKTKDENSILDKELEELFRILTLFSGNENCHKILEYLIRRYRVYELNVDSLISCLLHHHDTKVSDL